MRVGSIAVVVGISLACGGFMDDAVHTYEGGSAEERLRGVTKGRLPAGAADVRVAESYGIDWILNGEMAAPREGAEAWFEQVQLPCDQPTTPPEAGTPVFFHFLDGPWGSPETTWRVRTCTGSTHSGPHYSVAITDDGDPAWIWVHGLTM